MFHMHFEMPKATIEPILATLYEATGIGLSAAIRATGEDTSYCEISIGDKYADIPKDKIIEFMSMLDKLMRQSSAEQCSKE